MLWMKAFHIFAMVAWFAGLFYLPRLFVYHTQISPSDETNYQRFCTMERRLHNGIMVPAALITLLLGLGLMHSMHLSFRALPLWLSLKCVLVLLVVVFHVTCVHYLKCFARAQNTRSAVFFKLFNEIPTLLLLGIVLLVVLKPHGF